MSKLTYKDAGVDLDVYEQSMKRLPRLMHRTFSPRVLKLDGGFAGLFQLDFQQKLFARNYKCPVLVSGTDGVGSKLRVAQMAGRHHTVGIDLVGMCVNDVICCGAEPLFFLDYVAMSHDDPQLLEAIVSGISNGCVDADCALLGGETAIMPDLYRHGDYDLAGFCVGVIEKDELIDGTAIQENDVLIGVASSGLHSNGFGLARKAVFDAAGLNIDSPLPQLDSTVDRLLLEPTRIYAMLIRKVLRHYRVKHVVHGIAHITGGGIEGNIERIVPPTLDFVVDRNAWAIPPVFGWVQSSGDIDMEEMFRVFNMGIGMVLVVSPFYADSIRRMITDQGYENWVIGEIVNKKP
jgi:phosphoribosylformylglycinamidine cyclo-ligase